MAKVCKTDPMLVAGKPVLFGIPALVLGLYFGPELQELVQVLHIWVVL